MRLPRDERGTLTIELTIIFVAMLMLFLAIFQVALYQHARHVALAAAQEGARTAREHNGTFSAGQATAQSYLAALAPTLITNKLVSGGRTATAATVRVQGKVESIVPFMSLSVDESATGPVERFVAP